MIGLLRAWRRLATAGLAMVCFLLVGYALYTQYHDYLDPCPLCIFQRVGVITLGVTLLVAAALPARWRIAGNVSTGLVALAGLGTMAISARHLYIQAQPEGTIAACGAGLDYMLDVLPLTEVLSKVLTGSGECAKIDWTLLGLSMPGWVLIAVLVITTTAVLANWRVRSDVWTRNRV